MTLSRRGRMAVLVAIAAFLIGNVAFSFVYGSSAGERRQALEARRDQLAARVAERTAEASRLQAQRDRLSGVQDAVSEFYGRRVGTREATLAPLVEEIHRILRQNGAAPSQISYAVEPLEGLPLSRMRVGFSFRGDYAAFKRFLRDVAASRRWLAVQEAAVTRDPDLPGAVEVRIALATYFSGEQMPAPRPPARAAAGGRS